MTSKKSSAEPFGFTLKYTIKKYWVVAGPLLGAVITAMFFFGIGRIISMLSEIKKGAIGYEGMNAADFLSQYKYVIITSDNTFGYVFIHVISVIIAMILGIAIFRFANAKSSVNVYFSLGIRRSTLFVSRFIAGVVILACALLIPFVLNIAANTVVFGFSNELLRASAFYFCGLFCSALASYCVAVAVSSCVGSEIECVFYSAVILLAPFCITTLLNVLFEIFVSGSPYSDFLIKVPEIIKDPYGGTVALNPLGLLEKYIPVAINLDEGILQFISLDRMDISENFPVLQFDYKPIAVCFVICILIAASAFFIFKNRKAEKASFLGVCPALTAVCTFIISSFIVFAIAAETVEIGTTKVKIIVCAVCCAIIAAAFVLVELILYRNVKQVVKNKYYLLAQLAVVIILCGVFGSGLFGYSARIPEVEEIASVRVTTGAHDSALYPFSNGTTAMWLSLDGLDKNASTVMANYIVVDQNQRAVAGEFTEKENIITAREIHRALIEAEGKKLTDENGVKLQTGIIYTLKNGKQIARAYSTAPEAVVEKMNTLRFTDEYASMFAAALRSLSGNYDPTDNILIASSDMGTVKKQPALVEKKAELFEAMAKDCENGEAPVGGRKDEMPTGYISFRIFGSSTTVDAETDELISENVSVAEEFCLNDYMGFTVPVYPGMKNTLAFLAANGVSIPDNAANEIVKIRLYPADAVEDEYPYNSSVTLSGIFAAKGTETEHDLRKLEDSAAGKVITDKNEITENAKKVYFIGEYSRGGSFAELIFANGARAVGFIG